MKSLTYTILHRIASGEVRDVDKACEQIRCIENTKGYDAREWRKNGYRPRDDIRQRDSPQNNTSKEGVFVISSGDTKLMRTVRRHTRRSRG